MLTVGEIIKGTCIDVDYQGQGVIKQDGFVIFVPGLLEGEDARIKILSLRKQFGQGRTVEILKKHPDRIAHPQSILGSCNLLHMDPKNQLEWQKKTTFETLKKIMREEIDVEETITDGKTSGYRNKSVFHIMNKPYISLGLYHKNDYELIEVTQFILADQLTNVILKHISDHRIIIDPTILKHLVIRTNPMDQALVTLVATKKSFTGLDALVRMLSKHKEIVGITLNLLTNPKQILGEESITLYGENRLIEPLLGMNLVINDRSFYQINPCIEKAYTLIKDEIKTSDHVIDTYSGVGSIGFYIADQASKVTMIESNHQSIEMAEITKENYHLSHVEIIEGNSEDIIKDLDGDVLIVDPPRNGLMPAFIQQVLEKHFNKICYLSCDAKTLARDLTLLKELYSIKAVYPIRMFYHTTSLESLVILNRKKVS